MCVFQSTGSSPQHQQVMETVKKEKELMDAERQSLQRTITTLHQEKEGLRRNHEACVATLEGGLESLRRELREKGKEVESGSLEREERERAAREEAQRRVQQLEKVRMEEGRFPLICHAPLIEGADLYYRA